ncbi:hypothetical protein FB107DRAFT_273280 [Schizophyllum commune]
MEDQTVEEQRIEDLWFDDGDIRIAVGDQVCCVHRSALAEASPVLRDMFAFPQPPGDDPSRPPLFTFPDRPDQVLHWLKAMLLPGYFERFPQRIHKDKLLAVLCLSHKYLVDTLRQRCLLHLGRKFGTSLRTQNRWPWYFDDYEREMTIITDEMFDRDFLCALLPIAREVGALWILPALFYDLHFIASTEETWLDSPGVPLSEEDVARLELIEVICDAHFSMFNLAKAMEEGRCPALPTCCIRQAGKLREIFWGELREPLIARPFSFMKIEAIWTRSDSDSPPAEDSPARTIASEIVSHSSLCAVCQNVVLRKFYAKACRNIWDALPGILDIGSWDQLRGAKAQDMRE